MSKLPVQPPLPDHIDSEECVCKRCKWRRKKAVFEKMWKKKHGYPYNRKYYGVKRPLTGVCQLKCCGKKIKKWRPGRLFCCKSHQRYVWKYGEDYQLMILCDYCDEPFLRCGTKKRYCKKECKLMDYRLNKAVSSLSFLPSSRSSDADHE